MPETFAAAANAIRSHFATEWQGLGRTEQVVYDNQTATPALGAAYVALLIQVATSTITGLGGAGNRRVRPRGLVSVDVHTPVDQGDGPNQALVDVVATIFELRSVSGVEFGAALPVRVGPRDGWYTQRVIVPFYWDHFR